MGMPKQAWVADHLPVEALERRYRQAHDPVERSHFQIVWLLAQGRTRPAVATVTGYSLRWVGKIIRRYNQDGPDALGDRRHDNPGGQPILNAEQQERLWAALHGPAPDGGHWSGPKVAAWIEAESRTGWLTQFAPPIRGRRSKSGRRMRHRIRAQAGAAPRLLLLDMEPIAPVCPATSGAM